MAKAKMKQSDALNSLFDSVLSEDTSEKLTGEEVAALRAEAGETVEVEKSVEAAEAVEAEAKPVEATSETPTEPIEKKKLSPAQERITELVRERNAYEEQLKIEREKWARVDERAALVKEQNERIEREEQARAQQVEAAERRRVERPDPAIDAVGAELYDTRERIKLQDQEIRALRDQFQQGAAQLQSQQDVNSFAIALRSDLSSYRSKVLDYDEAAQYATDARVKMWQNLGYQPDQAMQLVQSETLAIAKRAIDIGKSPAETYYDLAKQWGWQSKTASAAITPKEKLAQVAAGQKVTGFSRVPNTAESEEYDIDTMSGADFAVMSEERFIELSQNPQTSRRMMKRLKDLDLA